MTKPFENVTPHVNFRRPVMLVLHGTAVDGNRTHAILSGQTDREVSCHYAVYRDGRVVQYVDDMTRAWHAGLSYWAGFTDINSMSIGIEIECESPSEKFTESAIQYTAAQMDAVIVLSKKIIADHKIAAHNVVAHQDIAPYRKADPGPHFPWAQLAAGGVGPWHGLAKTIDTIITDAARVADFKTKLSLYGYDPRPNADGADFSAVITAFQTHFLPWNITGQVTEQSIHALNKLLEMKYGQF